MSTVNGSSVKANIAAVLHGAKDLRITERTIQAPQAGQAQIAVKATGLCGSDLHYYIHGRNGEYVLRDPMALGHESAGEVVAVGEGVTNIKVGDRVAVEAGVYCKECKFCKLDRYNLCTNMRFASSAKVYPHADGTLQSFINHPAELLYPIPDSCSYEEASLIEPLSVVLHAARRVNIQKGQSVLVLGAGAVGLLGCSIAAAYGASHVVAVDINDERVQFSTREGFATKGYTLPMGPRPKDSAESLAKARETADTIIKETAPNAEGFDLVLECTGVESCIQAAVHCAKTGGKVCFVGMGTPTPTLPLSGAMFREVDLIGVFRYHHTYPEAIELFSSGKLPNASKLVTTKLNLKDANKAFEFLMKGKDDEGKLIIKLMVGDY